MIKFMTSNKRSTPKYINDKTSRQNQTTATDHKRILDENEKFKQILERLLDKNRQLSEKVEQMQRINAINRCRPDYYELRRLVELMSAENTTLRHYSLMLTDQMLTFTQMEIDRNEKR